MRKFISTSELSLLAGTPPGSIKVARSEGVILPAIRRGTRVGDLWFVQQALALACARAARKRGSSVSASRTLLDFLQGLKPEELEAAFQEGRTHVLILGQAALPKLISPAAVLENEEITPEDVLAAWEAGLCPALVDVAAAWRLIVSALQKIDGERRPGYKLDPKASRN